MAEGIARPLASCKGLKELMLPKRIVRNVEDEGTLSTEAGNKSWSGMMATRVFTCNAEDFPYVEVVDYEKPLLGKDLKARKEFNYYKFLFRQSGQALGNDFTEEHIRLLNLAWENHIQKMSKDGFGAYNKILEKLP